MENASIISTVFFLLVFVKVIKRFVEMTLIVQVIVRPRLTIRAIVVLQIVNVKERKEYVCLNAVFLKI